LETARSEWADAYTEVVNRSYQNGLAITVLAEKKNPGNKGKRDRFEGNKAANQKSKKGGKATIRRSATKDTFPATTPRKTNGKVWRSNAQRERPQQGGRVAVEHYEKDWGGVTKIKGKKRLSLPECTYKKKKKGGQLAQKCGAHVNVSEERGEQGFGFRGEERSRESAPKVQVCVRSREGARKKGHRRAQRREKDTGEKGGGSQTKSGSAREWKGKTTFRGGKASAQTRVTQGTTTKRRAGTSVIKNSLKHVRQPQIGMEEQTVKKIQIELKEDARNRTHPTGGWSFSSDGKKPVPEESRGYGHGNGSGNKG